MSTIRRHHIALLWVLFAASLGLSTAHGQSYTVRQFSDLKPNAWHPDRLAELDVEWSAFATDSICGKFLVLGAHPAGNPDRCAFVVYDLAGDAVVSRTPVDGPVEFMDWISRLDNVIARIDGDGVPTVRAIYARVLGGRSKYAQDNRLSRQNRTWRTELSEYFLYLPSPELEVQSVYWQSDSGFVSTESEDHILATKARAWKGIDDTRQFRWLMPRVVLGKPDAKNNQEQQVTAEWAIVGQPIKPLKLDDLIPMHSAISLSSQRSAQFLSKGIDALGVATRQPREIVISSIETGDHLHSYVLQGRKDYNVSGIGNVYVLGTSPDGQFACFGITDPYTNPSNLEYVEKDLKYGLLLVRLNPPWKMEIVLLPREALRVLWPADGQAYLVLGQQFLGINTRAGGIEAPLIHRVDFGFVNQ